MLGQDASPHTSLYVFTQNRATVQGSAFRAPSTTCATSSKHHDRYTGRHPAFSLSINNACAFATGTCSVRLPSGPVRNSVCRPFRGLVSGPAQTTHPSDTTLPHFSAHIASTTFCRRPTSDRRAAPAPNLGSVTRPTPRAVLSTENAALHAVPESTSAHRDAPRARVPRRARPRAARTNAPHRTRRGHVRGAGSHGAVLTRRGAHCRRIRPCIARRAGGTGRPTRGA